MTLPEVIVSALILGISSQASLQGWASITARAARSELRQQHLQQLDQQVLSAERLLFRFPVNPEDCRFVGEAVSDLQERLPAIVPLEQRLELLPNEQGIWLVLQLRNETSALKRRVLFTPAGLGLCKQAKA